MSIMLSCSQTFSPPCRATAKKRGWQWAVLRGGQKKSPTPKHQAK